MLRTNINGEKSDFLKIKDPEHIIRVWEVIEKNIPIYFDKIIEKADEFAALKTNSSFIVQFSKTEIKKRLSDIFDKGLKQCQQEDCKYKSFFSDIKMQEFEDDDDPKTFKSALSRKVPIILKARNSQRETMREWQERFATSKAVDVYSIFFNLIDFLKDYTDKTPSIHFGKFNEITELETLYTLNEDDDYNVPGVIGMGIKSSVLFFLDPNYFLSANKNTLYGFYFLSGCDDFQLPSRTNEFIMINDFKVESNKRMHKSTLIDQNYWYPYDLFILYSLRTYRKLKELCAKHGYILDEKNRFVHVNTFMSNIWNLKIDVINTMTGGDQDDAK